MEYKVTFEDGSEAYLAHYGVKGMKWRNRKSTEENYKDETHLNAYEFYGDRKGKKLAQVRTDRYYGKRGTRKDRIAEIRRQMKNRKQMRDHVRRKNGLNKVL